MNGYKIALLAWYAVGCLIYVTQIGKPRKPITPGDAAAILVVSAGLAFLVVKA